MIAKFDEKSGGCTQLAVAANVNTDNEMLRVLLDF